MQLTINYAIYCKVCKTYMQTIILGSEQSLQERLLLSGSICTRCRNVMYRKL